MSIPLLAILSGNAWEMGGPNSPSLYTLFVWAAIGLFGPQSSLKTREITFFECPNSIQLKNGKKIVDNGTLIGK